MRKLLSLLLAALLVLSLCGTAFAEGGDDFRMQVITCPEQDFCTLADADYEWTFNARDGITIYTEQKDSIPYVLVFRAEDWLAEPAAYIHEQFTPQIKKQYGDDLLSCEEFEQYAVGGRLMAAALYTYKLQGYVVEMLRAYDVQNGHTVVFTAKYIQGQGVATLEALDQAAAYYRPGTQYYDESFPDRWRYMSADTSNGDTVYLFDEVYLALPAAWQGKVDVEIYDESITFYHSLSHKMWKDRSGFEGGRLFSLAFSENGDFRQLPSYQELGTGSDGYYFLVFPTDFQGYESIPSIREEYLELYGQMDFVRSNAFCFHRAPVVSR